MNDHVQKCARPKCDKTFIKDDSGYHSRRKKYCSHRCCSLHWNETHPKSGKKSVDRKEYTRRISKSATYQIHNICPKCKKETIEPAPDVASRNQKTYAYCDSCLLSVSQYYL